MPGIASERPQSQPSFNQGGLGASLGHLGGGGGGAAGFNLDTLLLQQQLDPGLQVSTTKAPQLVAAKLMAVGVQQYIARLSTDSLLIADLGFSQDIHVGRCCHMYRLAGQVCVVRLQPGHRSMLNAPPQSSVFSNGIPSAGSESSMWGTQQPSAPTPDGGQDGLPGGEPKLVRAAFTMYNHVHQMTVS